jgi:hypothetical protein
VRTLNESDRRGSRWAGLSRLGAAAALVISVLLLGEIAVYAVLPRAGSVVERFALLRTDWLAGLLTLDLLGIVAYLLFVPMVLAIYIAVRQAGEAIALTGVALFLVGIGAFYASNAAFPALALSRQYAAASSDAERAMLAAAGQSIIALFNENAFHVSYAIVSLSWLLLSVVMLRSAVFGRVTSLTGMVAGGAGFVAVVLEIASPKAVAVAIGLYFAALVSLLAWVALAGWRLWKLRPLHRVS